MLKHHLFLAFNLSIYIIDFLIYALFLSMIAIPKKPFEVTVQTAFIF